MNTYPNRDRYKHKVRGLTDAVRHALRLTHGWPQDVPEGVREIAPLYDGTLVSHSLFAWYFLSNGSSGE